MMIHKKPPVLPRYAIEVGDVVTVRDGATDELRRRGWMDDYITENIDGKQGEVVADHRCAVSEPHLAVELGFSLPVGVPEEFLVV